MSERPVVVLTEPLAPWAERWLAERATIRRAPASGAGLVEALCDAQGLIVRTYTRVDAALLDAAPGLRVVGRAGVGLDNVDLRECARRGVAVVHTPDSNTAAVVEWVFSCVLNTIRPPMEIREPLSLDAWQRARAAAMSERELAELRFGILGLGRIGRRVARAASGFGCRTAYFDLQAIPAEARFGAEPVELDALLSESDVLSVHVDHRPGNRRLVDASYFERLKEDAIFLNASRGFVVDAAAAAAFFAARPAATGWFDVHDPEPFDRGYPLLGLPNVHLTPHVAGRTTRGLERMSEVVEDVIAVLEGRPPRWPAAARW